jgi:hypothetical protein
MVVVQQLRLLAVVNLHNTYDTAKNYQFSVIKRIFSYVLLENFTLKSNHMLTK